MIPADGPYTLTLGGAGTAGLYLDELRLWNLARSHQEIAENAALLQSAGRPGLLRSFRFDDGGSSIEVFAYPAPRGWQRLSQTAIQGAGATWSDNTETAPLRGMDDLNDNGIADWWEAMHFGRLLQPGEEYEDFDQDGLSNLYEFLCGTDPVNSADKSDYNALSADGVMTNAEKQFYGLDPRLADTDADGISDADEVESFLKRLGLEGKTIAQLKANVLVRSLISKEEFGPRNPLVTDYVPKLNVLRFNTPGPGLTVPAQYRHALQDWTLMARVKTSAGGGTLLSRGVGAGLNYELGLDGLVPYAKLLGSDGIDELEAKDTNIAIEADTWTHLAATYSSASGTLTL